MDYYYFVRRGYLPDLREQRPSDLPSSRLPLWARGSQENLHNYYRALVEKIIKGEDLDYSQLWLELFGQREKIKDLGVKPWLTSILPEDYSTIGPDWVVHWELVGNPNKEIEDLILEACQTLIEARKKRKEINKIAVLLPRQQRSFLYDFGEWDLTFLEERLTLEEKWKNEEKEILTIPFLGPRVGYHMGKESALAKGFSSVSQIFLTSPQGRLPISKADIAALKKRVSESSFPVYVHGRYIYNLCSQDPWTVQGIGEELEAGAEIGARGVVIHLGKALKLDYALAVERMRANVAKLVEKATPQCPLLLETCCRAGSEILSHPEEFCQFLSELREKNWGIVIDSCHVHAAGYDPLYFLEMVERELPGKVALVHFNDCKSPRGSSLDRHEIPGMGKIGFAKMALLYQYCLERGIDMVHE